MKKEYDVSQVGSFIGLGLMHVVYRYGNKEVIKFSPLNRLFCGVFDKRMKDDWSLVERYLAPHVVPVEYIFDKQGRIQASIQPYVQGEPLGQEHLQKQFTREAFDDLLLKMNHMKREKSSIPELISSNGIFRGVLGNILVRSDGSLAIIDGSILSSQDLPWYLKVFHPILWLFTYQQNKVIKKFTTYIETNKK